MIGDILIVLLWVYIMGAMCALASEWSGPDIVFWPIEIIRRYWSDHK